MFCPECKSEYRPGFSRCEDCGVNLVDVLPPSTEELRQHDPPVTVFVTAQAAEASLIASLLEGSGLEVFMFDEHLSNIDSPVALLIGGIKVAVPKHQEELARAVLEEYRGGAGQGAAQGELRFFSRSRDGEWE
jgi:hypothetical protein